MTNLFRSDVSVRSFDETERTVTYIASTEAVDSYGEIVEQDWILDRFNKNPVILYNHNRAVGGGFFGGGSLPPEATLPIGRSLEHGVILHEGRPALQIKVQFADADLNPFADKIFGLVRSGFLKGGSVGFNPHDVRREVRNDVETYILSKNELFEFSICPMGANPDAVSLSAEGITDHRALLQTLATRHVTQQKEIPHMDPEKMLAETTARAEQLASDLKQAQADLEERSARITALEAEKTELSAKLTEATARAEKSEDKLVRLEVEGYVGKKLAPAELEDAIADRKRDGEAAFAKRMEKRPDLKLLENKTPTSGPASSLSNSNPGERFAATVSQKASNSQ